MTQTDASDPAFFGYGSLVNLATHRYAAPVPATLPGWRRVWRATDRRELSYLSVDPDPGCAIDGVIAGVPSADWAALDEREAGYTRVDVTETLGAHRPTAVYRVSDAIVLGPDAPGGILLSYLDTVAQGFLQLYGEAGLARFFDTTEGWDTPVHDDRAAPRYSRYTGVPADQRALVDRHLSRLGAEKVPA